MNKRTILVAVLVLCLALSGCGGKDAEPSQPEASLEMFQALVDKVDSSIFLSDFEPGVRNTGAFYLAGYSLIGRDRMEETYERAPHMGYENYPYTPAAIFDAAYEPYFVMTAEELHVMIENYDPDIDGYWALAGIGGIVGSTNVTSYEVDGNIATLFCENPIPVSESNEIQSYAEVQMEYSEEYGWRFVSCTVSDSPP